MRTLLATTVAALVVLAGCSGAIVPAPEEGAKGTVSLSVGGHSSAIDQFESLTVTITAVGFVPRAASVRTPANGTPANATPANGTARANGTPAANGTPPVPRPVVFDVADRTVDLAALPGANATRLGDFDVPAGLYAGVFVQVSDATGTLAGGRHVPVEVPGERLLLGVPLTVGANGSTSYVFDLRVVARGRTASNASGNGTAANASSNGTPTNASRQYVLRPVVAGSGPGVPVTAVPGAGVGGDPGNETETTENATESTGTPTETGGNEAETTGTPTGTTGTPTETVRTPTDVPGNATDAAGTPTSGSDDGNETDTGERRATPDVPLDVALVGSAMG